MMLKSSRFINIKISVFLLLVLLTVYAPSFSGAWFFDDYTNILQNDKLHITSLNASSIQKTFFSKFQHDNLYRPLPCLTLGLNWYFGQDHVLGYHIVNFIVHFITTVFLFLSIKLLLQTPRFNDKPFTKRQIYTIAFFTTLLWAVHPIQTQAITYIVQRMASMAGMFFIIGIFCYLYAKLCKVKFKSIVAYTACAISFICAVLSKENAIVFPAVLILIHWIFFIDKKIAGRHLTFWICGLIIFISIAILAGIFYLNSLNVKELYTLRFFAPIERLLTETRVIFLYFYQIFYPIPSQFQVEHYIIVSKSLLSPISTLFSVIGIGLMLIGGLFFSKRWPLLSFAILFYLGCHAIESTIVPLELVYEHRNYIPSMFIFLPVVVGFLKLLSYLKEKPLLRNGLITGGLFIIIMVGFSTFLRNQVWQSEENLYLSAITKYPQLSRAYNNLGVIMKEQNKIKEAIYYYEKALDNQYFNNIGENLLFNMNLAEAYRINGDYKQAITKVQENISLEPNVVYFKQYLAQLYISDDDLPAAKQTYLDIIQKTPNDANTLYNLGAVIWKLGDFAESLPYFLKAYDLLTKEQTKPDSTLLPPVLKMLGTSYAQLGDYDSAYRYFLLQLDYTKPEHYYAQTLLWLTGLESVQNKEINNDYLIALKEKFAPEIVKQEFAKIMKINDLPDDFKAKLAEVMNEY